METIYKSLPMGELLYYISDVVDFLILKNASDMPFEDFSIILTDIFGDAIDVHDDTHVIVMNGPTGCLEIYRDDGEWTVGVVVSK